MDNNIKHNNEDKQKLSNNFQNIQIHIFKSKPGEEGKIKGKNQTETLFHVSKLLYRRLVKYCCYVRASCSYFVNYATPSMKKRVPVISEL